MILFDVSSLPKGVDINVWYSLYEKGLCIYDSTGTGLQPIKIDADSVSFIDINSMNTADRTTLTNSINEILEEKHKETEEINNTIRENNRQLINYLKSINNEYNR
jgi:hypothetical protein